MTEINCGRGMPKISFMVTLLTDTHLEPSISNFDGQLKQVKDVLTHVLH